MGNEFLVQNLLELQTLHGATLLAGFASISTPIKAVNIMEVPDIYDWSQCTEFLMTTGYSYRKNPLNFLELIPKLKAKGVSALGIKTHRFIEEIPAEVIHCANTYNLPLFELPAHTVFSNVIKEVMENILLTQRENREEFYHHLFSDHYSNYQFLDPLCSRYSLPLKKESPYYILLSKEEKPLTQHIYERLQKSFLSIINDHSDSHSITIIHYQNSLIILLPTNRTISTQNELFSTYPILSEFIQLSNSYQLSFCLSNQSPSILNLSEIYNDVLKLRNQSIMYRNNTCIITWNSLGIYSIISQIPHNITVNNFVTFYTRELIAYDQIHASDLYPTLIEFLNSNCNMKITASKMYLHYNTICYRMKQIKSITNFDLTDINVLTNLNLAIKLQQEVKTTPHYSHLV